MTRKSLRGFGELMLTVGMVLLLFATYEVYGKVWEINAGQNQLDSQLDQQWAAPGSGGQTAADPLPGDAVARLHIPRLGKKWVVVEGVSQRDIKKAPGRFPTSQMPGELGNFAMAGHRTPAIWWDLDKMEDNDLVIVETRTAWLVYRVVVANLIIKPTAPGAWGMVAGANPDRPGAKPTKKLLTMMTCNPKWDNYERLIVRAQLVKQRPKSAGNPPELGEG